MGSLYRQLSSNHFRLLEKVTGAHDRDLRFRFVHDVPGQAPSYTAVSYTWGDDMKSEVIYVNDKPFMIRPNLWACLYCLRRSWQFIWADAICINQDNIAERNEQVRMMGHIYAGATVVSAWLGNVPLPAWLNYEGRIVTLEVDDFDWAESMEEIASRPYWSRSWVIQEFLMAREVHIYCGNARVDDQFFQEMLARATDTQLLTAEIADLVQKPDLMRKWPALPLVVERHVDRYPSLPQPLYDLLASHAYAQSTDPRDKVFALLGLLPSEERVLLERSFPDYSLSEEQVKVVTLAHLKFFAGDRRCEPIFRALRIDDAGEIRRLLQIVESFDYVGADDPAAEVVDFIETIWHRDVEDDSGSPTAWQTCNSVLTPGATLDNMLHQKSHRQKSNFSWIMGCLGFAVSVLLLYRGAVLIWRQ